MQSVSYHNLANFKFNIIENGIVKQIFSKYKAQCKKILSD